MSCLSSGAESLGLGGLNFNVNESADKAQGKADEYNAMAAQELQELRARATEIWDTWKTYYGPESEIGKGLISEATYTPEKSAVGRGMAVQDVDRQFQVAQENLRMRQAAQGVNPGSPAAQALDRRAQIAQTAARAGAATGADRAYRAYTTGVGMNLSGQGTGMPATSLGGTGAAAGTTAGIANSYNQSAAQQAGQGPWWFPTASLGDVNEIAKRWFKRGGINAPTGGQVEDPPQFDQAADIPMVKGPDGSFGRPGVGMAGHLTGPGNETSDSIPAELSKNEYVVPAFATIFYGTDKLDKMVEKARVGMGMAPSPGGAPQRVAGESPQPQGPPAPAAGPGMASAAGGVAPDERRKVDDLFEPVRAPWGGSVGSVTPAGVPNGITAGEPGGGFYAQGYGTPQPGPSLLNAMNNPSLLPAAAAGPNPDTTPPDTLPALSRTPLSYFNDKVRFSGQYQPPKMNPNSTVPSGVYSPFMADPYQPTPFRRGGMRARRGGRAPGCGMRPVRAAGGGAWGEAGKGLRQPAPSITGARP